MRLLGAITPTTGAIHEKVYFVLWNQICKMHFLARVAPAASACWGVLWV